MQWYERLDEKLRDYLPDMTVEHDVPMSRHTSFRIGGPVRLMARVKDDREFAAALKGAAQLGLELARNGVLLVSGIAKGIDSIALKEALKKIEGTDLEKFLRQYNAI